jgi:protein-S-isoprenylcysteine O-methyltransferase Ste14
MTFILSATAGISAVRFGWANLSWVFIIPGIVLFIFSSFFGSWAILVNKNFKSTIIVEEDGSDKVCRAGPYRYIRHPGYLAWIIGALGYPLILGTAVCYIPVGLLIILFVLRTWLEDNTLNKTLAGYRLYTEETRYRLVPFIW